MSGSSKHRPECGGAGAFLTRGRGRNKRIKIRWLAHSPATTTSVIRTDPLRAAGHRRVRIEAPASDAFRIAVTVAKMHSCTNINAFAKPQKPATQVGTTRRRRVRCVCANAQGHRAALTPLEFLRSL